MNIQNMIGMLRQGNTGSEILEILDSITAPDDSVAGYNYVESPMIKSVLGIQPTLESIDF